MFRWVEGRLTLLPHFAGVAVVRSLAIAPCCLVLEDGVGISKVIRKTWSWFNFGSAHLSLLLEDTKNPDEALGGGHFSDLRALLLALIACGSAFFRAHVPTWLDGCLNNDKWFWATIAGFTGPAMISQPRICMSRSSATVCWLITPQLWANQSFSFGDCNQKLLALCTLP